MPEFYQNFVECEYLKKKSGLEKLKSGSKRGGLAGPTRMGGASLHFSLK